MFLHILFIFLFVFTTLSIVGTISTVLETINERKLLMRLYLAQQARRQAFVTTIFLIALFLFAYQLYL